MLVVPGDVVWGDFDKGFPYGGVDVVGRFLDAGPGLRGSAEEVLKGCVTGVP